MGDEDTGHGPPPSAPLCSRLPGLHDLDVAARIAKVAELIPLDQRERGLLAQGGLTLAEAERLIENVIGLHGLPIGLCTNVRVNGRDYLVPMVIEESSVVAAACSAARLVREHGELRAEASPPVMIGQIQLLGVAELEAAERSIAGARERLLALAAAQDPRLVELGGGPLDLELRRLDTAAGPMLVVHLLVDVRDAMGANAVNTMAEALGPILAELAGGELGCRILSNLSDRRLARARLTVDVAALGKAGLPGEAVARRIVQACAWAEADPYRAATHNKGVMNAVDAVLVATGNDWRAVEAGGHAHAARSGRYRPLTRYAVEGERLIGEIELPLAVGIVGGMTRLHPISLILLKILRVGSAGELAALIAAVGLLQNLAALRSLVTEGIQRGQMSLHARSLAIMAGARGEQTEQVAGRMIAEGQVRFHRAREILAALTASGGQAPEECRGEVRTES